MNILGLEIQRIAHSCIKVITNSGRVIYFDPFKIESGEKADYIFISHEHYDHCSVVDIKKIIKPETIIITVPDCQSKLAGLPVKKVHLVKPGDAFRTEHFDAKVVPAYNISKHFHLKDNAWVGFVVRIDGKILYHVGDSDVVPEMRSLSGIDVMFVPVSGEFVMDSKQAANLVNAIKPKVAIPIHYGAGVVGTQQDAENFKSLVNGSQVIIL
jgi:L-ascorbate metabolism protein UlaG (beta-lactamase superfamily)